MFKCEDTDSPPCSFSFVVIAPTGNCIMDYVKTSQVTVLRDKRIMPGVTDLSLEPSSTLKEKSTFKSEVCDSIWQLKDYIPAT